MSKDYTVGKIEFTPYAQNNLTYSQFKQNNLQQIIKKRDDIKMNYIDEMTNKIKQAKNDNEIKDVLCEIYFATQYDSSIRAEFDNYFNGV